MGSAGWLLRTTHFRPLRVPLCLLLVIASYVAMAPLSALGETDEQPGIPCTSIPSCLVIFEDARVSTSDAYAAGRYLIDHADQGTAKRIAQLLHDDNQRLRERAAWVLGSRTDRWPGQVDDWKSAVRKDSRIAYELAKIGTPEGLSALLDLAMEPEIDVTPIGSAIQKFDRGQRAVRLGLEVIHCSVPCPYPQRETLLRGLFADFYATDIVAVTRKQILASLQDRSMEDESRRLAFVAYQTTLSYDEIPDWEVLDAVYADALDGLRKALAVSYPGRFDGRAARLNDGLALLPTKPEDALHLLAALGPDAHDALDLLLPMLKDRDASIRGGAADALWDIDRVAWRQRLVSLVHDSDPMLAAGAVANAAADSSESLEVARRATASHWFPGLPRWAKTVRFRPQETEEQTDSTQAPIEIVISNDATYFDPLFALCPDQSSPSDSLLGLPSLMHQPEDLIQASQESDVATYGLSAALHVERGWLVGTDEGEFGGNLLFAPAGSTNRTIRHSAAEVVAIFRWRDMTFAIVGSYGFSGIRPELVRVDWNGATPISQAIFHFPAAVIGVYGDSSRLLFMLQDSGTIDLTSVKTPRWLGCDAHRAQANLVTDSQ